MQVSACFRKCIYKKALYKLFRNKHKSDYYEEFQFKNCLCIYYSYVLFSAFKCA